MNEIQVFSNPDFGNVRMVLIDNEPWFVSADVSKSLGYAKTASMTKLVEDDDKRNISSSDLGEQVYKQTYTIGIINESGLYAAIFGSKLENAKRFKKWVTSDILPSIRKTGTYGQPQLPQTVQGQIQLLAQGNVELNQRVDGLEEQTHSNKEEIQSVKEALNEFKETLPLLPEDADEISNRIKKRGVEILGGKQSAAYNDQSLRMKLYRNYYSNLKYNFGGVSTYKAIKRNQKAAALDVVEKYEPPLFLKEQIENVNAQQNLNLEGGAAK